MELAMGAMAPLVPKLLQLLGDEYLKQKGLQPEVESLSRELAMIHAALEEVSLVPPDELKKPDQEWARQVRELLYDMEDAVDAFMVRVANRQLGGPDDGNIFKKITGKVKKFKERHRISDKIKDIKNIAKDLGDLRARYNFSGGAPPKNKGVDPRVINLYKDEGKLVGVEEPRDELIRRLTYPKDQKSLKIVSIVGTGGLGKTTLAKLVFDQLKPNSFDCSAYVSVGRNPNITKFLREMLEKLDKSYSNDMTKNWTAERLFGVLHEFLQSKRYIIFVDDVWEKNTWEAINCVFPDTNFGSRVILTTRISEVSSKAHVFKLKPLSPDKSRELFCKRISRGDGDKELDKVSEKIIAKCGGVPLAIIAIASLLADRPLEDWRKVYDSIIFGHEDNNNTRTILLYSYYDLPSYLKPCVLYLSIYPEDHFIEKSRLIWRWIAEGFIQLKKERLSLFEVGETYFNELLNRSMIQPAENNEDGSFMSQSFISQKQKEDGSIKGCHVHDIVLDLIRDLSAEENFVTILDDKQCASSENVTGVHEVGHSGRERKVRRLSIQKCHEKLISHDDTMSNQVAVRSVYIMSDEAVKVMPLLSKLEACRVLATDSRIRDPKNLSKLLHLRYLEIKIVYSELELPKEIGNLKSLQTLMLLGYFDLKTQMLATICGLTQLKCLRIDPTIEELPNTIGRLISLEELKLVVDEPADCWVQFGKLTRLRVLEFHIWGGYGLFETCIKDLVQSLSNLQEIKELHLRRHWGQSTIATWDGWKLLPQLWRLHLDQVGFSPQLIDPLCFGRLRYLFVRNKVVEAKDLENLALLPELLYLHLHGDGPSQRFIVDADGFKKLMVCEVPITLKFLQGAMPCLESLEFKVDLDYIANTELLATIPEMDLGLRNLLSLREVVVHVNFGYSCLADVEEAEAAIKRAVEDHPNRPTLEIRRDGKEYLLCEPDEEKQDTTWQNICLTVRDMKDKRPTFDHVKAMQCYPNLERIRFYIDCKGSRLSEVAEMEAALRHAADVHPKRPCVLDLYLVTRFWNREEEAYDFSSSGILQPDKVSVREWKDGCPQFDPIKTIQHFDWRKENQKNNEFVFDVCLLKEISFDVDCEGAGLSEVEELEEALRNAAAVIPDCPPLLMTRINEDKMASTSRHYDSSLADHNESAGNKITKVSNDAEGENVGCSLDS